ncbi:MAG: methyltransferase domain-containing protein [Bacteroidales bacterium]|nr:methyltransferase domain-containing protein [Bacteroidales bacterium]
MYLDPELQKKYGKEHLSALEAQRRAEFIAWGPVVFQASRLMLKFGILQMIAESSEGMTQAEIVEKSRLSPYAVKVLVEASLCIGTVLLDTETERFRLSKTGWFLLNDRPTRINIDFNHDVNYEGWFHLEESLLNGKPEGLRHFGDWPTIYEGLSSLPSQVQQSWFGFDHFYSDESFDQALEIVFSAHPRTLLDVGGNTGRWALRCVDYDKTVEVTIMDLPQQLELMRQFVKGKPGFERIGSFGANLLDDSQPFPSERHYDAIWMSQFLDCFAEKEIVSILRRAAAVMDAGSRLYIMETFWDRQRFDAAAFCLTMTSLYFTAMANGNSKMYHSEDMEKLVREAGLQVEVVHDGLGQGHSIMVCKKV